jgi:high-affinity Fe2+/Pb2+ permease
VLCIILAGKGVHALIAAGVIPPHPWGGVDLPTLGVFPDALTLSVQGLLVGSIAAAIVWTKFRKDDAASPAHRVAGA